MSNIINSDLALKKFGAPQGQKRPLRPREVWAIRASIEMSGNIRNLALLNLAIDSKLRGYDLVRLKVFDVYSAGAVRERAMIAQKKTARPVQFEITKLTAGSVLSQIKKASLVRQALYFRAGIITANICPHDNIIASLTNR